MRKLASAALLCALVGCGGGARSHEPQVRESGGSERAEVVVPLPLEDKGANCCQSCPLAVAGVKVDYAEFGGVPAMVFVTSDKSQEEELRRRVTELAVFHNKHDNKLAMLNHPHRADVKPVEGGMRMDIIPDSGFNESSGFRREVEREVKWMQEGHCPPLGEHNECVSCDLPKG
jgi:hypothetical protein